MKRIEEYEKELQSAASEHLNRHIGSGVMYLCGKSGMGKTLLTRQYVKDHGGLYFSFRGLDAALAPKIFFPDCSNWDDFFRKILETKNRPVIFFDDMDNRNDKDIFLEKLPVLKGSAFVVLIYRMDSQIPAKAKKLIMKPLTPPDLCREYKKLDQKDALRIIAITDGIPALVNLFRLNLSFEENIRNLFAAGSLYLRYAEENLQRKFRSPESYNTLLYGLAIGCNRISQLAEFSDQETKLSELSQTMDHITARVSVLQTGADTMGRSLEDLSQTADQRFAQLQLRSDGLAISVGAVEKGLEGKADARQVETLAEHFRFGDEGMTITDSVTGMAVRVSQEQVAFSGGTDDATRITPSGMATTDLTVGRRLDVGSFSFIPRTGGNLSLRWTGK